MSTVVTMPASSRIGRQHRFGGGGEVDGRELKTLLEACSVLRDRW